jgi:hypothetical protein
MSTNEPSFFARLGMAFVCFFRILFRPQFAAQILTPYRAWKELPATAEKPVSSKSDSSEHASALFILSMLQREGRLIDFLQEELAGFSDAEVGTAARVVHSGCRKVISQYLSLEPVLKDAEGATVRVPEGFDSQKIRLVGNIAGRPPFSGALKHHGWITQAVRLPPTPAVDVRVLAPAEVELS